MDDKEKSFVGTLHCDGNNFSASIGFQKAYSETVIPKSENSSRPPDPYRAIHHETVDKLYASSYKNAEPTLFYFRHINGGEYAVYSRSPSFHSGKHLCINNSGVISASDVQAEINYFSFQQNGQRIQIHEKIGEEILAEFVCKDGGIEFHNIENPTDDINLTAQVVSKGGRGPLGNIRLKVIKRDVDWLSANTKN
ncbi:hypothetical protein ACIOZM_18870 [Pseudomonas sp. NPDC087346]|uniref:hypothetical protein n=1 Tax=Pseudomonas sp. NPDC087346 TaxID=3364438 RepID=UPI0038253124